MIGLVAEGHRVVVFTVDVLEPPIIVNNTVVIVPVLMNVWQLRTLIFVVPDRELSNLLPPFDIVLVIDVLSVPFAISNLREIDLHVAHVARVILEVSEAEISL
jgi:hypothetical protein